MNGPAHFTIEDRRNCRSPRGAVLVLVLGAVAILAILAVELSSRAKVEVVRVRRDAREGAIRRAFRSGVEIATGVLLEKRKNLTTDSLADGWTEIVTAEPEPGVKVRVRLSDESGKLNLLKAGEGDAAARRMARLFAYLRTSEPGKSELWTETEKQVQKRLGLGVTEAQTKELALLTLDCLREGGVSRETLYGRLPAEETEAKNTNEHVALCDLLTLYGDGRVNLNTAPAPVLYALHESYDDALVEQIQRWRGDRERARPFQVTQDLEQVQGVVETASVSGQTVVVRNRHELVKDLIAVKSTAFTARFEVTVDGRVREGISAFLLTDESGQSTVRHVAFEEIEP